MEKEKMVDKACEKLCEYYDDDGTCNLDCLLCCDALCERRQSAKEWHKKNEIDAIKDQVRKEKAKEILEKVGNIEDCGGIRLKQYVWFTNLCKENGVEVENDRE